MKKITLFSLMTIAFVILISNFASAVRFDTQAAMKEEWDRYLQYKADYISTNHLEAYADQVDERNLMANFGFYGPAHYAISPEVWNAKYNPPLQGEAYYTENRGMSSSLAQASAVKYYADNTGGRYTGFVPSTLNGVYFDHPQANGVIGTVTTGYAGYGGYGYGYQTSPENYRYYARMATNLGNGYYVVGYQ